VIRRGSKRCAFDLTPLFRSEAEVPEQLADFIINKDRATANRVVQFKNFPDKWRKELLSQLASFPEELTDSSFKKAARKEASRLEYEENQSRWNIEYKKELADIRTAWKKLKKYIGHLLQKSYDERSEYYRRHVEPLMHEYRRVIEESIVHCRSLHQQVDEMVERDKTVLESLSKTQNVITDGEPQQLILCYTPPELDEIDKKLVERWASRESSNNLIFNGEAMTSARTAERIDPLPIFIPSRVRESPWGWSLAGP